MTDSPDVDAQSSCSITCGQVTMLYLVVVSVLVDLLVAQLDTPQVIADTRWGRIYGQRRKTVAALEYYSFEGVPYALPPLGFLRFAKPVPLIGRRRAPYRAYSLKPSCHGIGVLGPVSEDCLYLDIYVPATQSPGRKSVMVYLHGGGFVSASPQPSVDALMSQLDTILVVVHYRLGPLGFLSVGESFLGGNFGLWDQTMALRWVRTNMAAFGGDPGKVTIFGSSAGAASVAFHVLSPASKDFFQRAIMLSGSSTATWALHRDPRSLARALVTKLGCRYPADSQPVQLRALVLLACLRRAKAEHIHQAGLEVSLAQDTPTKLAEFLFVPVVDGEFVPGDPRALLGNQTFLVNQGMLGKDIMVGVVNNEGSLMFGNPAAPSPPEFGDFFDRHLIPKLLAQRFGVSATESAVKAVSQHYTANIPRPFLSALGVAHAYGDPAFVIPAIDIAQPIGDLQFLFKGQGKTLFYYFDYCPVFTGALCMMHGLDNLYLFPPTPLHDVTDARVSRMFVELLTSFSLTGVPRADGMQHTWSRFNTFTGHSVLRLNASPQMQPRLFSSQIDLWLNKIPQLMAA